MRDEELETFMVEMCRRWPNKFPDEELKDMHRRLRRYMLPDVLAAADEHKNTSKFVPKISELLARLKGKERDHASGAAEAPKWPSYAETVRRWIPAYAGLFDAEVIMRQYRAQWHRYATDANKRFAQLAAATMPPALCRIALDRAKQQARGARIKCQRDCTSALVGIGVATDEAARWADWIFVKPDSFRTLLDDLRSNGIATAQSDGAEPDPVETIGAGSGGQFVEVFQ